jgi:hypothetical protein
MVRPSAGTPQWLSHAAWHRTTRLLQHPALPQDVARRRCCCRAAGWSWGAGRAGRAAGGRAAPAGARVWRCRGRGHRLLPPRHAQVGGAVELAAWWAAWGLRAAVAAAPLHGAAAVGGPGAGRWGLPRRRPLGCRQPRPWPSLCRRCMQLQTPPLPITAMCRQMYSSNGVGAFYRGFFPNLFKNAPNKSGWWQGRSAPRWKLGGGRGVGRGGLSRWQSRAVPSARLIVCALEHPCWNGGL